MKTTLNIIGILAIFCVSISACKKKDTTPDVVLPTNLQTTISHASGNASIQASAQNANFYSFTFFENGDSTRIESQQGTASYTFSQSGTYTIKTRAHTTQYDFIEKIDQVIIYVDSAVTGAPTVGYSTPLTYPGLSLVWNDEFDGATLSSDWTYDIGTGSSGWGNNELQYYTNDNVQVSNGLLQITAKSESFNAQDYTSTRIKTQGLKSWKYGRIDVRAALPYGKGIWPAIWMLGDNITTVGWPACGEIDIMELIGGSGLNDRTVHGTAHWSNSGSHAQFGNSKSLSSGKFADEFHVFSIVWNQNSITWMLDDVVYNTLDVTPTELSEFQENFFLIMNVAVGGNWPGSPDATTIFPQTMYVDYVRIFQ
ncbi:MAG: glycoside hydrolase family 16 protein [Bacteroidetes bacterium]|nr:glycoside hydrolase family 16 protein [Bacteroidota bacterium]